MDHCFLVRLFVTVFEIGMEYTLSWTKGQRKVRCYLTVVYLDTLVLLNLWLDGLLLTASRRLAGLAPRWKHTIPAAALGGAYAGAAFCLRWEWLTAPPVRMLMALGMVWLAADRGKSMLRIGGIFLLLSCTLAGAVLLMGRAGVGYLTTASGFPVSWQDARLLMLCGAGEYALVSILTEHTSNRKATAAVLLSSQGRTVLLRTLLDTGNLLKDPLTGQKVLIAEYDAVSALLPPSERLNREVFSNPVAHSDRLGTQWGRTRLRLLPYHALGTERGLLLAVRVDRMEANGTVWENQLVAVTGQRLSENGRYQGILHP